jgi:hypothetical protein
MKSYFIQREGGRLYVIGKMNQQEYGAAIVLNGEKPSVANPMQTFLTSLAKSASKLSNTFHALPLDGCTITRLFSRTPLCHLICLVVLFERNNRFNFSVTGRQVMKLFMCDLCRHLFTVLVHNFNKPKFTTA